MIPQVTLHPDLTQLETKIRPLVKAINSIGVPTYYSCEGHGTKSAIIQSPFPKVGIVSGTSATDSFNFLRLLRMLGIHNGSCHSSDDVAWVLVPQENLYFIVRSQDIYQPLEIHHRGINILAKNLRLMAQRYNPTTPPV